MLMGEGARRTAAGVPLPRCPDARHGERTARVHVMCQPEASPGTVRGGGVAGLLATGDATSQHLAAVAMTRVAPT
jgi:hypothetical protein